MNRIFVIILITASIIYSQVKIVSIEKLDLPKNSIYNAPKFSPDGNSIFFTDEEYNIIWKYNLTEKSLVKLIEAPKCGYGFSISDDGNFVSYRVTTYSDDLRERIQEIYQYDIEKNKSTLIAKSGELSLPSYLNGVLIYSDNYIPKNLIKNNSLGNISVLGIEFGKIVINKYGEKIILDPYKNGSYIWPVLSNKKDKILAYEADRGSFICDLNGTITKKFGRLDAAEFNFDDKWIIYMDDKDDGEKIISSDIMVIDVNNNYRINLTNTPDIIELNPSCSKISNKVTYNTIEGDIYILTFEEVK